MDLSDSKVALDNKVHVRPVLACHTYRAVCSAHYVTLLRKSPTTQAPTARAN